MNGIEQVSQAAEFFRIREEERKQRVEESKNFRRAAAVVAGIGAAKMLFGRRGS